MNQQTTNSPYAPLQQHIAERIDGIEEMTAVFSWNAKDPLSDEAHRNAAKKDAEKYQKAADALYGLCETGYASGKNSDGDTITIENTFPGWDVAGGKVPEAKYPKDMQVDDAIDDFIYRLWGEEKHRSKEMKKQRCEA